MPDPAAMDDAEIMRELAWRLNRGIGALILALESGAGQDVLDAASRAHAEENTAFLKALVAAHGWPGEARFGEQGQAAAGWLLAFSARTDPDFQNACLDLLARMLAQGEVDGYFYAFTVDRVLVSQRRRQRFGTQEFTRRGRRLAREVEDPQRLNARRTKVGLEPVDLDAPGAGVARRYGSRRRPSRTKGRNSRP